MAVGIGACIIWLAYQLMSRVGYGTGRRGMLAHPDAPEACTNRVLDEPWSEAAQVQVASPKRPRSNASMIISFCLLLRLEVFLAVSREAQCSTPGIEVCFRCLDYKSIF